MSAINIIAIFLSVAALAGFCNTRFVKLPPAIGMMLFGLIASLLLLLLDWLGLAIGHQANRVAKELDVFT